MLGFAASWAAFLAWAAITFTLLERAWPHDDHRPSARRLAAAALLLGIDAAIARALVPASSAPVLQLVAAWLVAELLLYWVHRAMHRVPVLWRFHRLHHADTQIDWATAWLIHPVDATLFATCALAGGLLTGAGPPGAVWFVVGRRVWTIVLHANLAWPASWLDRIIATPPFHRAHHERAGNYASTLPLLDHLFGTATS